MLENPKIKSSLEIYYVEPETIYVAENYDSLVRLKGKAFVDTVRELLKGKYAANEIVERLSSEHPLEQIYYVFFRLQELGIIYDSACELNEETSSILFSLSKKPNESCERIKSTPLFITSFGSSQNREGFEKALTNYNLKLTSSIDEAKLIICLLDSYFDPDFGKFAKEMAAKGKDILPLTLSYKESWAGPYLKPTHEGYESLLYRMNASYSGLSLLKSHKDSQNWKKKYEAAKKAVELPSFSWGALEVLKFIVQGEENELQKHLVTFDFMTYERKKHYFLPLPAKKTVLKNSADSSSVGITLKSQKKTFTSDGGHRIVSPKKTVERLEKYVSPILGVVQNLSKHETVPDPLYVYQSSFAEYLPDDTPLSRLRPDRSGSAGKGKGEDQAKASCLCEAIERYCCFHALKLDSILASYDEIREDAIHPDLLQNYSAKQFENRKEINARGHKFVQIAEPFENKQKRHWSKIWSMTEKKYKWIPKSYFTYNFENSKFDPSVRGDSNGCASGNTLEEAILQGFFELVERDQCALWWYSRFQVPELDLDTFKDPYVRTIQKCYEDLGRKVWVLNITLDLNIPTFAAISTKDGEELIMGLGSHLDPDIALSRALSEMNQGITMEKGCLEVKGDEHYFYPHPDKPKTRREDFKKLDSDDLAKDVLICQKIVEDRGLELLITDLSHPEIELKVARVIVPGLRHFWQRLAPGRLYDVPYKLGLVEKKLTEDELNPVPITF